MSGWNGLVRQWSEGKNSQTCHQGVCKAVSLDIMFSWRAAYQRATGKPAVDGNALKAVLHQSEAGNSCAPLFLVPFVALLISWDSRLDQSVSKCPKFSVSEPQRI